MKRAAIAVGLIAVLALTVFCCVLDEPLTFGPSHHHQTVHRATIRAGARHGLDFAALGDPIGGQTHLPVMYGEHVRRGQLLSSNSCELVTPLRI
ncbi:MAG TPA: hypothetical protein VII75_15425 [Thermoanaerobaculia bacterium]|nr:hypothetical protein [Thermoanaerobaculia bacterium]